MSYYEKIDPIGEEKEKECAYCGIPTNKTYCCKQCKNNDLT